MKSLIDFIKESLNGKSKSRDSKYFRFKLTEIEDSTSKIIAAAEKDGLFVEKTDNGCKVKIYKTSKVKNQRRNSHQNRNQVKFCISQNPWNRLM